MKNIYIFPSDCIGAYMLFNKYYETMSVGTLVKEQEIDIVLDQTNKEYFRDAHCLDCQFFGEECVGIFELSEHNLRKPCKAGFSKEYRKTLIPTAKIKTPKLLLIQKERLSDTAETTWHLLAFKEENNRILTAPYCLANVYSDCGKICWGGNPVESYLTHKSAFNAFFSSAFNSDLVGVYQKSLKYSLENYNVDKDGIWTDYTDIIKSDGSNICLSTKRPYMGALITNDVSYMNLVPSKYKLKINGELFVVGWLFGDKETKKIQANCNGFWINCDKNNPTIAEPPYLIDQTA